MKQYITERVLQTADYVLQTHCTVRCACRRYKVGKSTTHKDLTERLKQIDYAKYAQVQTVLVQNNSEKHMRGGLATKRRFKQ